MQGKEDSPRKTLHYRVLTMKERLQQLRRRLFNISTEISGKSLSAVSDAKEPGPYIHDQLGECESIIGCMEEIALSLENAVGEGSPRIEGRTMARPA